MKNDYLINEKRAGLIKIGDHELSVDKKLSGLEIKSYKSGFLPDFIKFKTVSKNGKELMHLKFQGGELDGIKVYDDKYVIPKQGVRVGNTAQQVIDKGIRFTLIHFGDREGLRCELAETKLISGNIQSLNNLQMFFDKKVYQNGTMRNIGANATLQSILIGDNFDIRVDTLTDTEKKKIRNQQHGKLIEGKYINKYYGIKMDVPSGWTYNENFGKIEDFINLCYLKNEKTTSIISLYLQENTNARDGKQYLGRFGLLSKIEQINDFQNGKLYRKLVISKNDIEHEVFYSIKINRNSILIKSKWISRTDLKEIEDVILTLRGIKAHNTLYK
ncbi:hypothetical protein C1H87_22245 [Flavivirga eckloniae]|uniref:Uncharacterized protein n=2 Tax=Flavivirga eckloniae TaxID=1803846 RepID=A0A2K9PW78_9FLAO|nr:hypothetical protein C1H87_22245 [Flavivirga eckloniae]